MEIPDVLQEKVLWSLDLQIKATVNDWDMDHLDRKGRLAVLCLTPWELADAFRVPSGDPTEVIDRYRLRAVGFTDPRMTNPPVDERFPICEPWATGIDGLDEVPIFSPLDVWKALRSKESGDLGVEPPPISCEADLLLRSLCRGYRAPMSCCDWLISEAQDISLIGAALSEDDPVAALSWLEELINTHRLWMFRSSLEGEAASRYWQDFSASPLNRLRKVFGMASESRSYVQVEWVSPLIISLIEAAPEFQDALHQPRWLLYKAVAITRGKLPEDQHNFMLGQALADDLEAKAYCEFLNLLNR
jgi:hypothetical protein